MLSRNTTATGVPFALASKVMAWMSVKACPNVASFIGEVNCPIGGRKSRVMECFTAPVASRPLTTTEH